MAFQYAAKFICGLHKSTHGLAHGTYQTDINVHNPGKDVELVSVQARRRRRGRGRDDHPVQGRTDQR